MNEKIQQIVTLLKNSTAFTDVVADRLFPLVALKATETPFVVYNVSSSPMSKDGRAYSGGLQLFFAAGNFGAMCSFADVCTGILSGYDVGDIETDYSPEYETIYATINFNIE